MKVDACVHHWEIELADGPTSNGVCKLCGSVKDFENTIVIEGRQLVLDKEQGDVPRIPRWRDWHGWF